MIAAYTMKEMLGSGIYTIPEAALYAQITPGQMTRWLLGTTRARPAVRSFLEPDRNPDRLVTFYDLVQCMAIREIRKHRKVSIEKIRQTIDVAERVYGITYPFARKHMTKLLGDEISLYVNGRELVEVTGSHRNQFQILTVVEKYLDDLSWDADGLACSYTPLVEGEFSIVLDRRIQFGEPIVKPGRHTARTLYDAYRAEGSVDAVVDAYGVAPGAVDIARKYFEHLGAAA